MSNFTSKWNEFNFGKNIHAKTLANYLQNYEIKSVHKATGNGYLVSSFVDPIKRYILEHVKPSMDKSFLQPFSIGTYKMNSVKDIRTIDMTSIHQALILNLPTKLPSKKSLTLVKIWSNQFRALAPTRSKGLIKKNIEDKHGLVFDPPS